MATITPNVSEIQKIHVERYRTSDGVEHNTLRDAKLHMAAFILEDVFEKCHCGWDIIVTKEAAEEFFRRYPELKQLMEEIDSA